MRLFSRHLSLVLILVAFPLITSLVGCGGTPSAAAIAFNAELEGRTSRVLERTQIVDSELEKAVGGETPSIALSAVMADGLDAIIRSDRSYLEESEVPDLPQAAWLHSELVRFLTLEERLTQEHRHPAFLIAYRVPKVRPEEREALEAHCRAIVDEHRAALEAFRAAQAEFLTANEEG